MTDEMSATDSPSDNSATEGRRSLLKKAAVAGGVAWAAPVLLSQPAFAQGSVPPPQCTPVTPGGNGAPPCGGLQTFQPAPAQVPDLWIVNSFPTGPGSSPTISGVNVTGGSVYNTIGMGSNTVQLYITGTPTLFCVTINCGPQNP